MSNYSMHPRMRPTPDQNSLIRRIKRDIPKYGQSVVYVTAAEPGDRNFAYTVGRAKRHLPELLVVADLDPAQVTAMLNHMDRLLPTAVPSGTQLDLGGRFPVLLIDATDPATRDDYVCIADSLYPGCAVQQIVLCDRKGAYPPDCEAPFDAQPLLGTLASAANLKEVRP